MSSQKRMLLYYYMYNFGRKKKKKRMKKRNFSDAEIEVLLSEVHSKRHILFSSVHSGVSGPKKKGFF